MAPASLITMQNMMEHIVLVFPIFHIHPADRGPAQRQALVSRRDAEPELTAPAARDDRSKAQGGREHEDMLPERISASLLRPEAWQGRPGGFNAA